MKTRTVCLTCILAALYCTRPAHAAVIMTLEQVGPDVVATGTGTVNLTALSFFNSNTSPPQISPQLGVLLEGNGGTFDTYSGISGPSNFGPGSIVFATTGGGDPLAIQGGAGGLLAVPHAYVSGAPLSSTATWNGTTLAALGVTDGTYTWHWGSGANADSLTLEIGVPEPAPALLLALGAAALALLRWRSSTLNRTQ